MYRVIQRVVFPASIENLYPLRYRGFGALPEYETVHPRVLLVSAESEVRLSWWLGTGDTTRGEREGA